MGEGKIKSKRIKGLQKSKPRVTGGVGRQSDAPPSVQLHRVPKKTKKTFQDSHVRVGSRRVKPEAAASKRSQQALRREKERRRAKTLQTQRRRQAIQQGLITQEAPTHYDPHVAQKICDRYADGEPFLSILATVNYPNPGQFYRWVEEVPSVRTAWEAARRARSHVKAEETIDISDFAAKDHHARTPAHALRVRSRQWYSAKLNPSVYGERLDMNHSGVLSIAALSQQLKTVQPPELTDSKGRTLDADAD